MSNTGKGASGQSGATTATIRFRGEQHQHPIRIAEIDRDLQEDGMA